MADNAIEVPNASAVKPHDVVTVSLVGTGTISHIVNGASVDDTLTALRTGRGRARWAGAYAGARPVLSASGRRRQPRHGPACLARPGGTARCRVPGVP